MSVSCRFCRGTEGEIVLDMGRQPACDHFPPAAETTGVGDETYPLRLWLCHGCRLAQLAEDPTIPDEPRAIEPLALVRQAEQAVAGVAASGLLPASGTVLEHGSPHGGSWLGLLETIGLHPDPPTDRTGPADVVVDCFGLMHDADQRAALELRADELAEDGVLLVQYHSLAAVLRLGQWNAIRHGHPVCLSTPALVGMLREVGLETVYAREFDLYGGTVLLAARRGGTPDASVRRQIEAERRAGVEDAAALRGLARSADASATGLRRWLHEARDAGRLVLGYGAASRAVPLLNHAGIDADLLPAIADGSSAKWGTRIPGTRIPIVAPDELLSRAPDQVVLFVPDLLDEMRERLPEVESTGGRWVLLEPDPRPVPPLEPALAAASLTAKHGDRDD